MKRRTEAASLRGQAVARENEPSDGSFRHPDRVRAGEDFAWLICRCATRVARARDAGWSRRRRPGPLAREVPHTHVKHAQWLVDQLNSRMQTIHDRLARLLSVRMDL